MSLKTNYPIILDNVTLPWCKGWSESSSVIENTKQTEGGTTIYSVVRMDKLSISAKFGCKSDLAKTLKELSKKQEMTLKRYDILAEAYEERTVVMRSFKADLVSGSETIEGTNGIWSISFKLEEI